MSARALIAASLVATLSSFCQNVHADDSWPSWDNGRGVIDSEIVVTIPSAADPTKPEAKCYLAMDTRYNMAPDAQSSASSPTRLVVVPKADVLKERPAGAAPANPLVTTKCGVGVAYRASLPDLDSHSFYLEGVIGAAVIPFKYYMGGDKGVKSNTAAIGYLGLKRHTPGGDYIIGIGGGPSQISVGSTTSSTGSGTVTSTATTSDSTQAGFSYGVVMLGQLKYDSPTQFGFVIGQDRVSKSAGWQNNGKWWLGFQIGTAIY